MQKGLLIGQCVSVVGLKKIPLEINSPFSFGDIACCNDFSTHDLPNGLTLLRLEDPAAKIGMSTPVVELLGFVPSHLMW